MSAMQDLIQASKKMTRRQLLMNGAWALTGCLLGFSGLPPAFAGQAADFDSSRPAKLALIIDDIGYSRSVARQFCDLNLTLTFSILPRLAYSNALALELQNEGYEIMLHQPMEPYNSCCDPGPGALYVGDNAKKIERILAQNIESLPAATGINNHMGSRFTASAEEMDRTIKVIKSRRLFFIDSVTSSHSVAYQTARKYHLSAGHRHVFLDNTRSVPAVLCRLHQLKQHAVRYGRAIGIGHPHLETISALARFSKRLRRSNVSLVHASQILFSA